MHRRSLLPLEMLASAALAALAGLVPATATAALEVSPGTSAALVGPDARLQVVVSLDGADVTRAASYHSEPPGVIEATADGLVSPVADGAARLVINHAGQGASLAVTVESVAVAPPVNFPNQVVPVFTKFGCNGGGCHGKVEGQNGFRLSLLGFEPADDYEYLVKEAHGRRVFPAAPEFSLLLRKASGELPHGGGGRLEPGTPPYQTLVRWIEQGMPYGDPGDPVVERVAVYPNERTVPPGGQQQLRVEAVYSDGRVEDVTRTASFEPNLPEMAGCDETGLVTLATATGTVAVMVRFHELVDVARFTVPLGAPVEALPPSLNFIDDEVFARLRELGLPPSAPAPDQVFLRRATLDIAGRLPTADEARAFAADPDPAKRGALVDRLLDDPGYAQYFAGKWNALFRNKRPGPAQERGARLFHRWLLRCFEENLPFDEIATGLLTASGDVVSDPAVAWFRNVRDTKEQLQDTAQVFLGVRMQCAQCHHHPYERWSQQDYYGLEAFFTRVARKPGTTPGEEAVFHRPGRAESRHPKTGQPVRPTLPGGPVLDLSDADDPRQHLAGWMAAPGNPYFAKVLVNRYWKHFFGRGLVEPEDDLRLTNPATHPALLERLAASFASGGYDLKALVRTICTSATYGLGSEPNEHNAEDRQAFSRFYPRRLPAELLSDAIDTVTGVATRFPDEPADTVAVALPDDTSTASSYFLSVFGRPEMNSACECERSGDGSLAQTLHLLNSPSIQSKLTDVAGRAAALAADAARPPAERVAGLYLAALAREPDAAESATAVAHLDARVAAAGDDPSAQAAAAREAFEDVVWALINTKEFLYNH